MVSIIINTIKDCITILATRVDRLNLLAGADDTMNFMAPETSQHENTTLSRLIAILASPGRPLTRRLICPSSSGLAAPLVQAQHWLQSLIMPPRQSKECASLFNNPFYLARCDIAPVDPVSK